MKMLSIFCMSIFFITLPVQGMDPTSLYELRRTGKEPDLSTVQKLTEISPQCFEQEEDIVLWLEKQVAQGYIDVNDLEIAQRHRREREGVARAITPLVELILKLEELMQQETSSESDDLDTPSLAEKYNDAFLVTRLPEKSLLIANQSLLNSMKILMKLSMLSRDFNQEWTIEKIGDLCKSYSDRDKDTLIGWLFGFYDIRPCLYRPLAVLIHAGFGKNTNEINDFVLSKVVDRTGCLPIVELLFKNKANPNIKTSENYPLLFNVKTVEEAQLFVDNKVDLDVVGNHDYDRKINVLWCTVKKNYPSELMKFYLNRGVDPKNLNHRGQCLLHGLVDYFCTIEDIDDHFKKIDLLLNAIPEMINLMDEDGSTPTGKLMRMQKETHAIKVGEQDYDKFIALFRKHGGRTQMELQPWYREGVHNKI